MTPVVFVTSVQHTGTHFAIRFLRQFYHNRRDLHLMREVDGHMTSGFYYPEHEKDAVPHGTVIFGHIPSPPPLLRVTMLLCGLLKTVIPIRDPLRALLTREARIPHMTHDHIVEGFVLLATALADHPNVVFLPIDLDTTLGGRLKILQRVATHCGILPSDPKLAHWAKGWRRINPTMHPDLDERGQPWNEVAVRKARNLGERHGDPGYQPFKELYEKRDAAGLKKALGPKWRYVEELQRQAAIITPFMLKLGYQRTQLGYEGLK